jgi:hypothetical protein
MPASTEPPAAGLMRVTFPVQYLQRTRRSSGDHVTKVTRLVLLLTALGWAGAATAQDQAAEPKPSLSQALTDQESHYGATCKETDPNEVVVCGRSPQRYRIDPNVLAASRAAEAPAPKSSLDATTANAACVGPDCGGATIPLVALALTAIKAAELAAQGDDWKEAFRTHPDQYKAYQQSKAKGGISIGVTAGNRRPATGPGY